jgi:hypothetical protein
MYITETTRPGPNGTLYRCVLLRRSYREGDKVKNRTIANLSHCSPQEIEALRLALRYKDDLTVLGSVGTALEIQEGLSVGAVCTVYHVAQQLGLDKALGSTFAGKLALWQIIARVIDQGSRLSAVRLAQNHAACELLGFPRGFDENDLYANLAWLAKHQATIERRVFTARRGHAKPPLFLYDVTSSYLEGHCNALAAFGYNRDGKAGKAQVVVGLLCDDEGAPVSTDVFAGNTPDLATVAPQIRKVAQRFGCAQVTFVGDRGMLKSGQLTAVTQAGFHYITALTKPQIEWFLTRGIWQLAWFAEQVYEVEHAGLRYILRRNPQRAAEIAAGRQDKQDTLAQFVGKQNAYLHAHPRAQVAVALRTVQTKLVRLKVAEWLCIEAEGRTLRLRVDERAQRHAARLDGCYVLKTDLPHAVAAAQVVHDRYKDLALVEQAFRTCKTTHLELRPWYVRTEASTRGHALVVMLAYLIIRELRRAWGHLNLTVEEGVAQLTTLCALEIRVQGQEPFWRVPKPRGLSQRLLEAVGVEVPDVLPPRKGHVVTRTKLPQRRKA